MNRQQTLGLAAALLVGAVLSAPPAQAQPSSFIVTLTEEGPDVVATGSGTINTTDLRFAGTGFNFAAIDPNVAVIFTGPTTGTPTFLYTDFVGPTNFGSGVGRSANSGVGDFVGITLLHDTILLPSFYGSGSPLLSMSTWDDATFASLGVRPGTYEWTWGSGDNAGTFTLRVATPEPATLGLMVLGLLGGAGFAGRQRRN